MSPLIPRPLSCYNADGSRHCRLAPVALSITKPSVGRTMATDVLDAGMRRLDELTADLDRLAQQQQR